MMERTFEIDGAKLTVHSATVRSRITRDVLISTLAGRNPGQAVEVVMFADLVAQTTLDGGDLFGWALPSASDTEDVLQASFDAWLALPASVYDDWQRAIRLVDVPRLPELDEEKKAPSSTE
jgi:hypothetical protein